MAAQHVDEIVAICEAMTTHENARGAAAHQYFDDLLPDDFQFRRVSRAVDDKKAFLGKLQADGPHRQLQIPVDAYCYDDVINASLIIKGTKPNEPDQHFRNVRVFRRYAVLDLGDD